MASLNSQKQKTAGVFSRTALLAGKQTKSRLGTATFIIQTGEIVVLFNSIVRPIKNIRNKFKLTE
jgi:hypothetical protein